MPEGILGHRRRRPGPGARPRARAVALNWGIFSQHFWGGSTQPLQRDTAAAKRFFRKALGQPHAVNPRTVTVDKNPAYPRAVTEMKAGSELWRRSRLRQFKYLNNIVEQDHRRTKRLTRSGLGFGSFWTARRTLAGYEVMAMVRKGQVRRIDGRDMRAQATFIAELFDVAA